MIRTEDAEMGHQIVTREALDWVGREVSRSTFTLGRHDLLKYAYATRQTSPVYLSVEAARAAGHRDLIAPFDYYIVLRNMSSSLVPTDQLEVDGTIAGGMPPMRGQKVRAGGVVATFSGRLTAGDTVTVQRRFGNIYEKVGRSGALGFVEFITDITSEHDGQTIVSERYTRIVTQ